MGRTMLFGVLRMPSKLWHNDVIDIAQRESRYHEAADIIEQLDNANADLTKRLEEAERVNDRTERDIEIVRAEKHGASGLCCGLRKIALDRAEAAESRITELEQECQDRQGSEDSLTKLAIKDGKRITELEADKKKYHRLLTEAVKEMEFAKLMDTPLGEDLLQALKPKETT